ncbi:MAG: molybdate ABC transporter substrate-binding protein [Eubacteriales bacterium]|nr:molybdate ABC transporter substrate-binding protein [Eubacteriales bacterium]
MKQKMKQRRSSWGGIMLCIVVLALLAVGCGSRQKKEQATSKSEDQGQSSSETAGRQTVTLTLAAAASLKTVFEEELIPLYEKTHPNIKIEATYDSSGKLQNQIEQGLQADIFFSAATKQMTALAEGGFVAEADIVSLLENRVVLIQPKTASDKLTSFQELQDIELLAIGDPASVPAGQYAQKVLTSLGLWDGLQDRLSLATNVTEVLQWVEAGSAPAGIVYATDAAHSDQVRVVAEADRSSLEQPVIYPVTVLKAAAHREEAMEFVDFLHSPEAIAVFEGVGFTKVKE